MTEAQMIKVVEDIELTIAEQLMEGKEPAILIGNFESINEIKKFIYGDVEVDFRKGVAFTFGLKGEDPKEDGIVLIVYRSPDLEYGKVIIL